MAAALLVKLRRTRAVLISKLLKGNYGTLGAPQRLVILHCTFRSPQLLRRFSSTDTRLYLDRTLPKPEPRPEQGTLRPFGSRVTLKRSLDRIRTIPSHTSTA